MALAARWLDPTIIRQLAYLRAHNNIHAIRAQRQLDRYRQAKWDAPERRDAKRAFERHAQRALGDR
jgi:hypothetical protein